MSAIEPRQAAFSAMFNWFSVFERRSVLRFRTMRAPLEPGKALEVIDEVHHLYLDAGDADGAYDELHAVFLPGEHVLERRADGGAPGIGPGNALGHSTAVRFPLVDVACEHALGEERLALL